MNVLAQKWEKMRNQNPHLKEAKLTLHVSIEDNSTTSEYVWETLWSINRDK